MGHCPTGVGAGVGAGVGGPVGAGVGAGVGTSTHSGEPSGGVEYPSGHGVHELDPLSRTDPIGHASHTPVDVRLPPPHAQHAVLALTPAVLFSIPKFSHHPEFDAYVAHDSSL